GHPKIHYHVHLPHAAGSRHDGPGVISCGHGSQLSNRCAVEYGRRIQIDRALDIAQVLAHVVSPDEQPAGNLAFDADREDLAARVYQLVRIVRQQIKIKTITGKLRSIEIAEARA